MGSEKEAEVAPAVDEALQGSVQDQLGTNKLDVASAKRRMAVYVDLETWLKTWKYETVDQKLFRRKQSEQMRDHARHSYLAGSWPRDGVR